MGNLIFFEDHHPGIEHSGIARHRLKGQSLIPLQLALNEYDIERCFALLSNYGKCPVFPRANPNDEGRILFLVHIDDAIALNQQVLEGEVDEQAVADRIDLIQMLENCEESLLSKAWDQIGMQARRQRAGTASSVSHVGR
ncbi:MAG: hypothetical protein KJN90_05260 [Gammaproteobacteria bacterium]|nr:hypothetical protein [Gammaproteobacteria bacterium]